VGAVTSTITITCYIDINLLKMICNNLVSRNKNINSLNKSGKNTKITEAID